MFPTSFVKLSSQSHGSSFSCLLKTRYKKVADMPVGSPEMTFGDKTERDRKIKLFFSSLTIQVAKLCDPIMMGHLAKQEAITVNNFVQYLQQFLWLLTIDDFSFRMALSIAAGWRPLSHVKLKQCATVLDDTLRIPVRVDVRG